MTIAFEPTITVATKKLLNFLFRPLRVAIIAAHTPADLPDTVTLALHERARQQHPDPLPPPLETNPVWKFTPDQVARARNERQDGFVQAPGDLPWMTSYQVQWQDYYQARQEVHRLRKCFVAAQGPAYWAAMVVRALEQQGL